MLNFLKYAIIDFSGTQLFVQDQEVLTFSKFDTKTKSSFFLFDKILLVRYGKIICIGQPYITNSFFQILGTRLPFFRTNKVRIFKMKSKKKYRKTFGYTSLTFKCIISFIVCTKS